MLGRDLDESELFIQIHSNDQIIIDFNYICELPFHYPEDHGWFKHINPTTIVSVQELEAGSIPSRVRRVAFHPGMITAPHPFSSQGLTYIDAIFQNSMLIISTVCPPSSSTSPSVLNSTNQWATIFLPLSPT